MFKKNIKNIKNFISQKPVKYLLVGGFNTLVSYLIYAFFIFIGLHYFWAVLISTLLGVVISFNTQGRLVFGNFHKIYFLKYGLMVGFVFILNLILIYIFYNYLKINYYFSGLLSTGVLAIFTYFVSQYWVFLEKK